MANGGSPDCWVSRRTCCACRSSRAARAAAPPANALSSPPIPAMPPPTEAPASPAIRLRKPRPVSSGRGVRVPGVAVARCSPP